MCLYTTMVKPVVAEQDIEVFKVLENRYNGLSSPYRNYSWVLGEHRYAKMDAHPSCREVRQGFHTYEHIEDARIEAEDWGRGYAVYKAIIPAGARYYKGKFGYESSFVSNELRIVEEVS